jgi:hypothetical protein
MKGSSHGRIQATISVCGLSDFGNSNHKTVPDAWLSTTQDRQTGKWRTAPHSKYLASRSDRFTVKERIAIIIGKEAGRAPEPI